MPAASGCARAEPVSRRSSAFKAEHMVYFRPFINRGELQHPASEPTSDERMPCWKQYIVLIAGSGVVVGINIAVINLLSFAKNPLQARVVRVHLERS